MRPMGTTITTFKKEESKVAKTNPNETVLTIAGTPEVLIVNGTKYYREDAIREHKDAMPEVKLRTIKDEDIWKYIDEKVKGEF